MIDWNDPEYKAAGHFYAIVDSVSITCADSKSNPADAQSYVYGQNASSFSPAVAVSNETTVNAAAPRAGIVGGKGVWTTVGAAAVVAIAAALL